MLVIKYHKKGYIIDNENGRVQRAPYFFFFFLYYKTMKKL